MDLSEEKKMTLTSLPMSKKWTMILSEHKATKEPSEYVHKLKHAMDSDHKVCSGSTSCYGPRWVGGDLKLEQF